MKKPEKRDVIFIFGAIAAAIICCVALIIVSGEKNEKLPSEYSYVSAARQSPEADDALQVRVITKTDTVYVNKNGKAFHIDKACAGNPENVSEKMVVNAIRAGKKKCGKCMKNYEIK